MEEAAACSIDGLRFEESIDELARVAQRSMIIFLVRPEEIRRRRTLPSLRESDFDFLSSYDTESSVDVLLDRADLVIDSSNDILSTFNQAIVGLRRMDLLSW